MTSDLVHFVVAQERRVLSKLFLEVETGLTASFSSHRAYPGIARCGFIGSRRSRRGGRSTMHEGMFFAIIAATLSSLSLPQPWGHHAPQSIHG